MRAEVRERTGDIRGVRVRWVDVLMAGHTVEQVLSFDIAEAEAVHGRSFDDEMDNYMQMGMFAMDRISADGTMHKVASAVSYVLDGKCIRTAKIEHCQDIEPMSAGWTIIREGRELQQPAWSCVPGTSPMSHAELLREIAESRQASGRPAEESHSADPSEPELNSGTYSNDDVTRFLRGVGERVIDSLDDEELKPDRSSKWAGSLGGGYRFYHLWHSSPPWDEWDMSYRITLRWVNESEDDPNAASWQAYVGFTYLVNGHEDLERWIEDAHIHDDQKVWTDELEGPNGQVEKRYRVIAVAHHGDALDQAFADMLAETLTGFIEEIFYAVDAYALSRSDQTDEVTDFLREVGERAIAELPDALKPDEKSDYAERSGDRRSYSLWYSRPPWQGDGLSYTVSLLPEAVDEDDASWLGYIGLSYWAIEDKSLISEIEALRVYDDQSIAMGNIDVSRRGDDLSEAPANTLAETLRHFIEIVTPVVDAFENERNGGDV